MICLYWNIRGGPIENLGWLSKIWFLKNSPEFVFIAEPWMAWDSFPQNWFSRFDLKLFAVNNRNNLLPNLWCFCKSLYDPDIILIDDQHISFNLNIQNSVVSFSIIYVSTNYLTRRHLYNTLGRISLVFLGPTYGTSILFVMLLSIEEAIPLLVSLCRTSSLGQLAATLSIYLP